MNSQVIEQLEFINEVFDVYAAGKVRSVTSLNITMRAQALERNHLHHRKRR
ncbi:MAG: hypothetical protein ACK5EO_01945 [Planctomycetota bacterium]